MISWRSRTAFERIRSGIARRLGLDINLLNSAVSIDQLHPAETVAGPPCIALPGQYERVLAVPFGNDLVSEIAEVQGAPRNIGPTLRYVIENVIVSGGILYARGRRKPFNCELDYHYTELHWAEYDEVALRSSLIGCHFFGDWLRDDCTTHLLVEHLGKPMSMPTPLWPHQGGYLALFQQAYDEVGRGHIRRLVVFDDIYQNAHKAERIRRLRTHVATNRIPIAADRIIYLDRGSGGKQRTLLNQEEVIETLARRGVAIVQPEALSVPQLIAELFGARIIIGIEGSQLCHGVFTLRDAGGLLVIQPPNRFFNPHMDWARSLNMRYGIVVGELRESAFYLPVDDLLRTIDLMDAKLP